MKHTPATLVVTIHGWNSAGQYMRFANHYLDRVGLSYYNYNYGRIVSAIAKNAGIVDRVVDLLNWLLADPHVDYQQFVLMTHSNGGEIGWQVARRCPAVVGLCMHNSALDPGVVFPPSVKWVHNWYTPTDQAVKLARWLPFNNWGDLGARPYTGPSSRVLDFNKGQPRGGAISKTHSDTFRDRVVREVFLAYSAQMISAALRGALTS